MDSTLKISRFAACLQVFSLTLRRQFFSRQTIVVGVLLLLALVITIIWAIPWPWSPEPRTGEQLAGQILSLLYMGFLLPIVSLGYASSAISSERTGQTLVYLLSTSIPRLLIYLSQFAAVLLLTLGISGSWISGLSAFEAYRPLFIGLVVLVLSWAGWKLYRPIESCKEGSICAIPKYRTKYRILFWSILICSVLLIFSPYLVVWIYQ